MSKLEEQLNEQTLQGTVSVNNQNLQQALIETAVLDDLNDVNISNPTSGQILVYQSGTNSWQNGTAAIIDGDKGDITTSGGGSTWTIDNNAVVEAKINTGAVTETKIVDSAVTENKVANNAITVNKIANDSVTNGKLANMATATVKGRATAGTGDPEDLAIDNDLSTVSANDDTIPSAKAVKTYVDILDLKTRIRNAGLINGFIRTTVASNNLTVTISKSPTSQVDPTATNPVFVWIGGVLRPITSALSVTANAGINWLNMGSAELATREVDLFTFMQWNSTTSAVNILVSRLPYPRLMGDFTNSGIVEKGVFGIVNYNSNDDVVLVDRFSATSNSSNNFTATGNVYGEPIYETRELTFTVTPQSQAGATYSVATNTKHSYFIRRDKITVTTANIITFGGTTYQNYILGLPINAKTKQNTATSASVENRVGRTSTFDTTNLWYFQRYDGVNISVGTWWIEGQITYQI